MKGTISPLVSIGLPVVKKEFLEQAIKCCLNQTYNNTDIIILNNALTKTLGDDIESIVFSFDSNKIKYYRNQEQIPIVENWNKVLSLSTGEYFSLLSDDDFWDERFIETMIGLAAKYPQVSVFHTRPVIINDLGKMIRIAQACPEYEDVLDFIYCRIAKGREQFLSDDKDFWDCEPYDVNAFNQYGRNTIYIQAGILQPPFYDVAGKKEANYGAIGVIIAHEISHAFDNNGAKYDEYGNVSDWWTEEDYEGFSRLLDDVVTAFDGYEVFPGIENNGILTLSENVADLGGLACSLSITGKLDDPDYDAFFRSWATVWQMIATRNMMEYLAANDIHSLNKVRINVALRNFDEFHETYGITKDDFLYLAPEDRIEIW